MCRKTYASDGAAEATWPRSTVDSERRNRGSTISRPTRFGTMGTTSTELRKKEQGGTMSRPTWPKDLGQEAYNRGSLEDNN
jgi:hypothetical protein